jgi:ATP-binding cassette, subfamily B, bacterial
MSKTADKTKRTWPVLKRYVNAAIKYPWFLALVFIGGLLIEGAAVGSSLVLKYLADLLATGTPTEMAVRSLYALLGVFALISFVGWCGQRVRQMGLIEVEPRAMSDLSSEAFQYLLGHSHDFFVNNFAGSLTRRVQRYARSFEAVLDNISFNFFSIFLYVLGVIAVLVFRSPWLAFGVFVWTILFIWVQIAMARWRQPFRIVRSEADSKVTGVLSDAIGNHSAISQFAKEKHEWRLFDEVQDIWKTATFKAWRSDNWIWGIQGLFVLAIEVAILAASVWLWERGRFTVGDFVLLQLYVMGLISRVWNIGNAMKSLYSAMAEAYEMVEIFEKPYMIEDAKDAQELNLQGGQVTFDEVTFTFPDGRTVLRDFNLAIQRGEKVAFVGPSGAGKSTISKLILRLYDVAGGSVRIDGQDIKSVTQASLRRTISYVPQEPVLFHRTLRDNIAYARPDATTEEVMEAARKAHCHEFIDLLPDKYETFVGERGVKLSGGERQRVAIARAILKNAPILVLDEATSSLDSESEALIQDALHTLMEGKTVIVIAHRLSTIMSMDRIIVLEKGKVVAEGTHDELLLQEGSLYHKLWSIQAGGFIQE